MNISSTGELSLSGFDLIVERDRAPQLWDELMNTGQPLGVQPMGEAAYDVLRIEAGWPASKIDFDEELNPHEAGMLPYINFNKGCYIGQEVIARLDTYDKVQKHLLGLVLEGDIVPVAKSPISIADQEVGYVTSACHSIGLGQNIALGYVRSKFADDGREVRVVSDKGAMMGKLVKLPFTIVQ